jgi:hypothetical protein
VTVVGCVTVGGGVGRQGTSGLLVQGWGKGQGQGQGQGRGGAGRGERPFWMGVDMRIIVLFVIVVLFATPGVVAAQDGASRRMAPTVGVFAGLGSGPIDAAAWGVEAGVPVWRFVAVRAEVSGWGNGLGGTMCVQMPPYSYLCSVSGWAGLVGLAANIPVDGPLGVFAEVEGGRFSRNWLDGETVKSPALSVEAGARVHLMRGVYGRIGGRVLRVRDDHYRELLGERLQYTMGIVGVEYRFGGSALRP